MWASGGALGPCAAQMRVQGNEWGLVLGSRALARPTAHPSRNGPPNIPGPVIVNEMMAHLRSTCAVSGRHGADCVPCRSLLSLCAMYLNVGM